MYINDVHSFAVRYYLTNIFLDIHLVQYLWRSATNPRVHALEEVN